MLKFSVFMYYNLILKLSMFLLFLSFMTEFFYFKIVNVFTGIEINSSMN
jgi:hypothetical protein